MSNPFKKKPWKPSFEEVTQYGLDIQRMMVLRDKAASKKEEESFTRAIHCMQEVMIFLNTNPDTDTDEQ